MVRQVVKEVHKVRFCSLKVKLSTEVRRSNGEKSIIDLCERGQRKGLSEILVCKGCALGAEAKLPAFLVRAM